MNHELRKRLARANELVPPDVWDEARARARLGVRPIATGSTSPTARSRVTAGVVALAVFLLAGALGWSALRPRDREVVTPGGPPHRTTEVYEPSRSMLPTIDIGQTVVVDIDAYDSLGSDVGDVDGSGPAPARRDIIAFQAPDQPDLVLLKRVIGLPGDRVEVVEGVVMVNGTPLDEPYTIQDRRTLGPWTVGRDHLFVMGDNRPDSLDSRFPDFGQVAMSDVMGKVLLDEVPTGTAPKPTASAVTSVG